MVQSCKPALSAFRSASNAQKSSHLGLFTDKPLHEYNTSWLRPSPSARNCILRDHTPPDAARRSGLSRRRGIDNLGHGNQASQGSTAIDCLSHTAIRWRPRPRRLVQRWPRRRRARQHRPGRLASLLLASEEGLLLSFWFIVKLLEPYRAFLFLMYFRHQSWWCTEQYDYLSCWARSLCAKQVLISFCMHVCSDKQMVAHFVRMFVWNR